MVSRILQSSCGSRPIVAAHQDLAELQLREHDFYGGLTIGGIRRKAPAG
jgi:hypothetical protein